MAAKPQTYEDHTRLVVGYHVVALSILFVNLLWRVYVVVARLSVDAVVSLLLAGGLILLWVYPRVFALTVQDRVIRLEMRLRLARLLPPDLAAEIEAFTLDQLIGLRFAGDAELPSLARRVLADHITDRKAIKKMVKDWQGDYLRV